MKYLTIFENHTAYQSYVNGSDYITPNISLCASENEIYLCGSEKEIYSIVDLGDNPNLDNITETGFYTYTKNNIKYNLIVQDYDHETQWCVQYTFTANNILRRYLDYSRNVWVPWGSIAFSTYNPNEGYISNAEAIRKGLKDANKEGLFVGDALNGRFVGLSDLTLAEIYDEFLKKKLTALYSKVLSCDLRKPEGDSQWDTQQAGFIMTANGKIILNTHNGGYNTSYGYYISDESYIILSNSKAIITANSYYQDQTLTVRAEGYSDQTFNFTKNTETVIELHAIEGMYTILPAHYLYIKSIEFIPEVSIIPGDAASLIYNIKYLVDGQTLTIPKGIYNVGSMDDLNIDGQDVDKRACLYITNSNITIQGAGNETIICGQSLSSPGLQHPLVYITGDSVELKDLTLHSTLLSDINGQLPTLVSSGKDLVVNSCNIIGGQDTVWVRNNSTLWLRSTIEGTVDFICGGQENKLSYFYRCNLSLKGRSVQNVICAPSGLITFRQCNIQGNDNYEHIMDEMYYLARPWTSSGAVFFIQTKYLLKTLGYTTMSPSVDFINYGDTEGIDIFGDPVEDFNSPMISSPLYQSINSRENIINYYNDKTRIARYDFN